MRYQRGVQVQVLLTAPFIYLPSASTGGVTAPRGHENGIVDDDSRQDNREGRMRTLNLVVVLALAMLRTPKPAAARWQEAQSRLQTAETGLIGGEVI